MIDDTWSNSLKALGAHSLVFWAWGVPASSVLLLVKLILATFKVDTGPNSQNAATMDDLLRRRSYDVDPGNDSEDSSSVGDSESISDVRDMGVKKNLGDSLSRKDFPMANHHDVDGK